MTVWTIGHSTLAIEAFIAALKKHDIETVVDVRKLPGSNRHPQFNAENLSSALHEAGIEYLHMPDLGGLRKPRPDSPNVAWRNLSFRGYADYMMTSQFATALEKLIDVAKQKRTVLMCAEAVWWQCHRAMISDALKARAITVLHIVGGKVEEHPWTGPAHMVNGKLTYSQTPQTELSL